MYRVSKSSLIGSRMDTSNGGRSNTLDFQWLTAMLICSPISGITVQEETSKFLLCTVYQWYINESKIKLFTRTHGSLPSVDHGKKQFE